MTTLLRLPSRKTRYQRPCTTKVANRLKDEPVRQNSENIFCSALQAVSSPKRLVIVQVLLEPDIRRKRENRERQEPGPEKSGGILRALRVLPWLPTPMTSFAVPDLLAQFRRLLLDVGELALQLLANKGGDDAEVVDNLDGAVIEAEKLLAGA